MIEVEEVACYDWINCLNNDCYLAGFYYSIQFDSVVAATWGLVYMILSVASVLTWLVIFIYSDSKNKLPWLFIIALFPVIGIILYLMLGHNFRETFRYRRRLKELGPDYVVPSSDYETSDIKTEMSKLSQMLVRLNTMTCRNDVSFRTKTRILTNGDQKFPVLIDAIKNAQEFIFIEYYIFNSDDIGMEVINALKERAQAGVDVKLLFDPLGTSRKMKHSVLREMREAGIVVAEFDPVLVPFLTNKVNHRNHRKIVVVDGRLAIKGWR